MPDVMTGVLILQVKTEVEEQIYDHVPLNLKQQAEESKKQVQEMQICLQNS